eukprot:CAMPEP_0201215038 /NCGR_PEP_ID=MMETSP0851-20130426/188727_1 /ASSEMBLY_ACC=CAM_ASM_000631 /TAXON_ID=183588 /ORGANISM="Pseudo-nitzschia fraudulenta, Strain WWA7" /LENGTH=298 /DNA_ID=CAMNT_0047504443 /DNA_START=82 /DNA_END=978 /DNA_ORIENTATION=+
MVYQKEIEELRAHDPDLIEEETSFVEGQQQKKTTATATLVGAIATSKENPVDSVGSSETETHGFLPLSIDRSARGHRPSDGTVALVENIRVSDLQKMTELFYERAFLDETLDKFIRSHDDPHASRFAKWIHQKLSGSTVWDRDRGERLRNAHGSTSDGVVVHDRTSAHVAAWHSPKRPSHEAGRRFGVDECRVWMRLHFWALRDSGLVEKSPAFADYYVRFIGHFVRVYETKAPLFARDSFRWSASPENIDRYIHRDGRRMTDVIGLDFKTSLSQIPPSEADDVEWPYNLTPRSEEHP